MLLMQRMHGFGLYYAINCRLQLSLHEVCCSGVSDKWGGIFFGFCKPKKFILQFVNNNEFGVYIVEVNISLSLIMMSSVY